MRVSSFQSMAVAMTILLTQQSLASTLREYLKLPPYLDKHYGKIKIEYQKGPFEGKFITRGAHQNPKMGPSLQRKVFKLSRPEQAPSKTFSLDLALGLFDALSSHDPRFKDAVEDLDSTYLQTSNGEYETKLIERIRKVFAERLTGSKSSQSDAVAQMWFHLKFEAPDTKTNQRLPQKGDPILLLQRQYGYFVWDESMLTRLRRRIDLGHSNLGIRYVGMGPENDIVINPGSKTRSFYETTLPNSLNPDVPNMVHVGNLWDWTQVQIGMRYMDVEFWALTLSESQIKALKLLIPRVSGLNFGPALAMSNNCADGAVALVNFLLPIERTFDAKSLFGAGPSLPAYALKRGAKKFGFAKFYQYQSIKNPDGTENTPGVSYLDVKFPRSQLRTFDEYLEFERNEILGR